MSPSRMPPASCWPVSGSVARSTSSTASGMCGSTVVPRRRSPRSWRRPPSGGTTRWTGRVRRDAPSAPRTGVRAGTQGEGMGPIRRAGRATQPGGKTIAWSQAEGARGTRWREVVTRDGELVRAVVLEVSPAGRETRLEVTTGVGMLTLHPEPDHRAMHGNVVSAGGVRHLAFSWSPDHVLLLLGSIASATVGLGRLATEVEVDASTERDVLRIDDALDPSPARWRFAREGARTWRLQALDGGEERRVELDPGGRPILPDAADWALES